MRFQFAAAEELVQRIELKPVDTIVHAFTPREPFCFSHHSGGSLCMVDFIPCNRLFLYFHRFPGTLSLCQAGIYLSRLISRAFSSA